MSSVELTVWCRVWLNLATRFICAGPLRKISSEGPDQLCLTRGNLVGPTKQSMVGDLYVWVYVAIQGQLPLVSVSGPLSKS